MRAAKRSARENAGANTPNSTVISRRLEFRLPRRRELSLIVRALSRRARARGDRTAFARARRKVRRGARWNPRNFAASPFLSRPPAAAAASTRKKEPSFARSQARRRAGSDKISFARQSALGTNLFSPLRSRLFIIRWSISIPRRTRPPRRFYNGRRRERRRSATVAPRARRSILNAPQIDDRRALFFSFPPLVLS